MKRIIAAILAFLYLSTSLGATVHLHYCMGKLVSWGFVDHENKGSEMCGMQEKATDKTSVITKPGCCRDEHKQVKTGGDQKIFNTDFQFLKNIQTAVAGQPYLPDINTFFPAFAYSKINAPPHVVRDGLFLLHRNFRI
jgi:hypothetical protein